MQVILLEHVEKLGKLGDEVAVKPGFARNYLLPQGKALRATADNIAYFEKERKVIEGENTKKRQASEKDAKAMEGLTVDLIRQASETGQLYGSVAARDVADAVNGATEMSIARGQVDLNANLKTLGLFDVSITLHPEVKVVVTVNIARTADEAEIQRKTGKALTDQNMEVEAPVEEESTETVSETSSSEEQSNEEAA